MAMTVVQPFETGSRPAARRLSGVLPRRRLPDTARRIAAGSLWRLVLVAAAVGVVATLGLAWHAYGEARLELARAVDAMVLAGAPVVADHLARGDGAAAVIHLRRLASRPEIGCASLVVGGRGPGSSIGGTATAGAGCRGVDGSEPAQAWTVAALRRDGADLGRLRVAVDDGRLFALAAAGIWPGMAASAAVAVALLCASGFVFRAGTVPAFDDRGRAADGNGPDRRVVDVSEPKALGDACVDRRDARTPSCGRSGDGLAMRLHAAFDRSPIAMVVVGVGERRVVLANRAAATLAGWSAEAVVGRLLDPVFGGAEATAALLEAAAADRPIPDLALCDATGEPWRWCAVYGAPVDHETVLLTLADVSGRKRAADRLRERGALLTAALENMAQGIVMIDREERIVAFNQKFLELLELPAELLEGRPQAEALVRFQMDRGDFGDDLVGLPPELRASLAEERFVTDHPAPIAYERRGCGGRVLAISCSPLPDGGLVKTYNDVTAYKRAEAILVQQAADLATAAAELEAERRRADVARAIAEEANRAKSRFLTMMSHELRTPLSAIIGFAEIMRDGGYGLESLDRYAEYAGDIHASGIVLLNLINDVLDISRIDAGKLQIDPAPLDLTAHLHAAVRLVAVQAMQQGVAVDIDIEHPPPRLVADERAVKQIVFNLVSNAVKFTRAHGAVRLRAGRADDGTWIAVEDTGIGIPADQIDRVLRPFEQLDSGYARGHNGTGLGLALVRGLVDLHGGAVRIDSEVGVGTTVTVTFPDMPVEAPTRTVIPLPTG